MGQERRLGLVSARGARRAALHCTGLRCVTGHAMHCLVGRTAASLVRWGQQLPAVLCPSRTSPARIRAGLSAARLTLTLTLASHPPQRPVAPPKGTTSSRSRGPPTRWPSWATPSCARCRAASAATRRAASRARRRWARSTAAWTPRRAPGSRRQRIGRRTEAIPRDPLPALLCWLCNSTPTGD